MPALVLCSCQLAQRRLRPVTYSEEFFGGNDILVEQFEDGNDVFGRLLLGDGLLERL
jgi:hypothetical protein